ncbi:MAG: phosphate signaling complex protein PhoU [Gammaproteobacteria bacterium]|jgi:phosphate transport system protein
MIERRVLSKDEQGIRDGLQKLSEMVQTAIDQACRALADLDTSLGEAIIAGDAAINAQQADIEQQCLTTIATQQPVATDLRVLVAALHISVELERMADYAASIGKTIIKMANEKPIDDIGEVLQMADSCQNMLRQAIQAYMAYDSERAVNIAEQDGEIDNMQTRISNNIIQQMCVNTTLVPFGSCLLWIVHNLERLGDRATNICEQIVYIKSGKFMDLNR